MRSTLFAGSLFVLMVVLASVMQQRNGQRTVRLDHIVWEENHPRLIAQDSVNKLLTLALRDSLNTFKSGLNLRNIEAILNQNDWIAQAQSYTLIDGGLGVQITTKLPIVRIKGDRNYYLDAAGNPFPLSPYQSVSVPFFYGNPTAEQAKSLISVVQNIAQDPVMKDHIVSYDWTPSGLAMEPRTHEYAIVLGDEKQLRQKLTKYKVFYAKMRDSVLMDSYKKINLSFHGQVVCSK